MPTGGTQLYCSDDCKKQRPRAIRVFTCHQCGKDFEAIAARKFCEPSCERVSLGGADESRINEVIRLYGMGIGMKEIAKRIWGKPSAKTSVRDILERNGVAVRKVSETQDMETKKRRYRKAHLKKMANKRLWANQIKLSELDLFKPIVEAKVIDAKRKGRESRKKSYLRQNDEAVGDGYKSAYHRRYETDPSFKVRELYKRRFTKFLGTSRGGSLRMADAMGCSPQFLRSWIESHWEDWMTWDNHGNGPGTWHVDHVVPCSWFDHNCEEELRVCWSYMNLRPLCSTQNLQRRNLSVSFGKDAADFLLRLDDCEIKSKLIRKALARGVNPLFLTTSGSHQRTQYGTGSRDRTS
jgi:hypothetical protein